MISKHDLSGHYCFCSFSLFLFISLEWFIDSDVVGSVVVGCLFFVASIYVCSTGNGRYSVVACVILAVLSLLFLMLLRMARRRS